MPQFYLAYNDEGTNDYASVMAGTAGGLYVSSDPEEAQLLGQSFAFGNTYTAAMVLLAFDTSYLDDPPPACVLKFWVNAVPSSGDASNILVAPYNWGGTPEAADWRTPAQLSALTPAGPPYPLANITDPYTQHEIVLDPAIINISGHTFLVMYLDDMASATPPTVISTLIIAEDFVNTKTELDFGLTTKTPPLGISYPFYTGSAVGGSGASSNPYNQPVSIAGHRYSLEWALYSRTTVSPFREARDQSALPGENSLNPLAAWKRSRDDWSLGAGQTWADRTIDRPNARDILEPRQFRASRGLDPWTIGELKLLPDTEVCIDDDGVIGMLVLGDYVYVVTTDADGVYRTVDPEAAIPTVVPITGFTGDPLAIATDGKRVFISTTAGMFTHDPTGTTASAMPGAAATYSPTLLEWTNGWLFGAVGNVIKEIRADGTTNIVYTHLNSGFIFAAITGTPNFTYFGGQAQDINEIYRVGVKTDGTLSVGIFSGSLPIGESIRSMSYYGAHVLIGSTKGVHLAAQNSDGSLDLSPVIRTTQDVACMAADSQFVWFGWTSYDTDDSATGLGRMDLSNFTDEQANIPAWASDLMLDGDSGDVSSVVRFQDHTYFGVGGAGVVREKRVDGDVVYVSEGTLEMGRFRWGTFEPKVWLGLEVVTDRLAEGTDGSIVMLVTNESGVTTGLGSRGPSNSSTGVGVIYGVGTISKSYDWFEPTVLLRAGGDANESTPIVRRVTLRALPVPKTIEQYTLPILMAEKVNDNTGEGGEIPYDTSAEYLFLQQLVSQGVPVNFSVGGERHLVTVREVGWDKVHGMTTDRKGVQGLLMVTLITAEI